MTDPKTTVLMPWDGEHEEWLYEALNSLPAGTPFVVAQNGGKLEMADALNDCLQHIDTEYTFVMGADDLAAPGMLELLEECIGDADGTYPHMEMFGDRTGTFDPPVWCRHIMQTRNICGVFLCRTEVLKAVGGWRDAVIEDWELVNRIAKAGYRFERVMGAKYLYRQYDSSLSKRIGAAAEEENFTAREQLVEILGEKMTKYPLEAVFYHQVSDAQTYVRAQLPCEYLPGVATHFAFANNLGADTSVWLHPGSQMLEHVWKEIDGVDVDDYVLRPKAAPIQIIDVDDGYVLDQLVPSLEWRNQPVLASLWRREQPFHHVCVQRANAVFCSTPSLAEIYYPYNPNVFVLRNSVLEADWRRVRKPDDDGKVRIGWAASTSHIGDAALVAEALRRVKRRHANVEVELVSGFAPKTWDFEYVHTPYTKSLPLYRRKMAEFDISLGPVVANDFGRNRSDLKWLDSSMAGAAFVGSDVAPFDTVKHGKTGLLCRTTDEWETALETLITDQDYRLKLAGAAKRLILNSRTAEHVAKEYRRAFRQIRKHAGVRIAA